MDVPSVAGSGGVLSFTSTPPVSPSNPSAASESGRTPSPVSLQPFYITARNPDGSTYQAQVLAECEETARQTASHFHRDIIAVSTVAPRGGAKGTRPTSGTADDAVPSSPTSKKTGLIKRLFGL